MEKIEDIVSRHGGVISVDSQSAASEYRRILRAEKNGKLIRIKRGVYALPYALMDTMLDVESIIPGGVVCLYNAWAHYGLTMQTPPTFCVAIAKKRKVVLADEQMEALFYACLVTGQVRTNGCCKRLVTVEVLDKEFSDLLWGK